MENKLELQNDILEKLPARLDNPLGVNEVNFMLTTCCNFACQYCFNNHNGAAENMSVSLAISFLENYFNYQRTNQIDFNVRHFVFSGGEPTLNSDVIFATLSWLRKNAQGEKYLPILLTNGIIRPDILEQLLDEKLYFNISYEGEVGKDRFSKTPIEYEKTIIDLLERLRALKRPVALRVTVSKGNESIMPKMVEFAAEHGVNSLAFTPISLLGNAIKNQLQRPSLDRYIHYYNASCRRANQLDIQVPIVEKSRLKTQGRFVELPKLVLLPDGSLTYCTNFTSSQADGAKKAIFGKFSLENGFLINKTTLSSYVRNFLNNIQNCCEACEVEAYCRGRNKDNFNRFFLQAYVIQPEEYFCSLTKQIFNQLKNNVV